MSSGSHMSWNLNHFGGLRYADAGAANMSGRMMQRGGEAKWIYLIISSNIQIFSFSLSLTFCGWEECHISSGISPSTCATLLPWPFLMPRSFHSFLTLAHFTPRLQELWGTLHSLKSKFKLKNKKTSKVCSFTLPAVVALHTSTSHHYVHSPPNKDNKN